MNLKKVITPVVVAGSVVLGAGSVSAYTVEKGDTMYEIAKDHSMKLSVLAELNPQIEDIDLIYPDQEVKTEQSGKAAVPGSDEKANVTAGQEKETFRNHELLAQLVEAEAKGETFKGKVAVAEVVLNRVEHSTFPDSVEAVIYQEGQFSPVSNGSINKPASEESKRAVHEAMGSEDITQGSLFFHNPAESNSSYMHAKQPIVIIGNHEFSK